MKPFVLFGLLALMISCQDRTSKVPTEASPDPIHHSASLSAIFDAHGGYAQWDKMQSLSYLKGEEATTTHLKNRKIKLVSPTKTIGYDGENVWVMPDTADASRARFYHNLYFYFFAMPFVVGDEGARYEDLGSRTLGSKNYDQLKVSYGEGVGDAPDDNYILLTDPETHRMEWLLYTVTYRSGAPNDSYHLIKYGDWIASSGLLVPTKLTWYEWAGDTLGAVGSSVSFDEITFSEHSPNDSLFDMPEGAQIAPR